MGVGLREAGRLAVLGSRQLTDLWIRRVVDYVVNRQDYGVKKHPKMVGRRGVKHC